MAQWKLTLAYDGTAFHGWQVQPNLPSVQQTLADALDRSFGERVLPQGSGRTDAGVHALGQVASFGLAAEIPPQNLLRALNSSLPSNIRVLQAEIVADEFHARRSAVSKTYEYRIFEVRSSGLRAQAAERICPPFLAPFVWDCRWPLHLDHLQAAAAHFCGTHDFASFAASDPDKVRRAGDQELDTVRTITSSCWTRAARHGEGLLIYKVTGTGFLHHMVRNLVGTMVDAGRGSLQADDMPRILAACDRTAAGPTAPARGLFLHSVCYGDAAEVTP